MIERKYWIIVASKDHVLRGVEGGFAQANHGKKAPLKRLKPGDGIIYYSSKKEFGSNKPYQSFTAIGSVKDQKVYEAELSDGGCLHRINVKYHPAKDVAIRPLLDRLNFITDKKYWGFPFRRGIFSISADDFHMIADEMLADEANKISL